MVFCVFFFFWFFNKHLTSDKEITITENIIKIYLQVTNECCTVMMTNGFVQGKRVCISEISDNLISI